jgi:DNA polymerase-4
MSAARRVIAHMDCDAFYYSVECLRDPTLVGKPVIVSGSGPRAVVTTASYEARRYGIGSAMPASRARRLCPQAIVVAPHGELYREKSQEVWGIVRERLQRELQHVSLDETYAEVTDLERPVSTLRGLVAEVRERAGITISVGIGPSRLVAKIASDARKPAGFVVLSREQACELFAGRSPRLLPGVGPKTADRLAAIGIETIEALRRTSEERLAEHFGARMAGFFAQRASFYDDSEVTTERIAKSRSSERTYDEDVSDPLVLEETVRKLAVELGGGLQRRGARGRTIGIKVRLDDWTNITRARTLQRLVNDAETITTVALELLREYAPPRPVRLLGVRVAALEEGEQDDAPGAQAQRRVSARRPGQLVLPLEPA